MIQRSKLAEELRDYQIRSQRKYWVVLLCFSAKPQISTRIYKYAIEIARAARWLSKGLPPRDADVRIRWSSKD